MIRASLAAAMSLLAAAPALAGVSVDVRSACWSHRGGCFIRGSAGQTYTVRFTLGGVVSNVTVTVPSGLPFWVDVPAGSSLLKGDSAEIVGKAGSKDTALVSMPSGAPGEFVLASHTISTGSLAIGTNNFTLHGTFDVQSTSIDANPGSPGFGAMTGFVPAGRFEVFASPMPPAPPGPDVVLVLDNDLPFSANLLPSFTAANPQNALTSFSVPIAGHLAIAGMPRMPFNGTATGQSRYRPVEGDGREDYTVLLSLSTPLGPASGSFATVGRTMVMRGPRPVCNPADIASSDASAGSDGCVNNGDFQRFFTDFFTAECPDCP